MNEWPGSADEHPAYTTWHPGMPFYIQVPPEQKKPSRWVRHVVEWALVWVFLAQLFALTLWLLHETDVLPLK